MRISDVLTMARPLLVSGQQRFICFAVDSLGAGAWAAKEATRAYVIKQLEGNSTLGDWLLNVHGIDYTKFADGVERLKATRLAWLDHMVEELRKEGK